MSKKKEIYLILSGEGGLGFWSKTKPLTETGLKQRLTKERCEGDRFARAYKIVGRQDFVYILEEVFCESERALEMKFVDELEII